MNTDDDVTQPIIRVPSQFGVCLDAVTKKESRCVLSAESCETDKNKGGEVYSPPYERQHTFLSSSSLSCMFPHDVSIGRCTSSLDDKRCSPSSDSCGTKSVFYNITDPSCSLLQDNTDTNKSHGMKNSGMSTTFPACYNYDTKIWQCVLDQNDCITINGGSSEQFKYAKWTAEWADQPCHCEDIPTGVCYVDPRSPNNSNTNNNDNNTTISLAMTTTTSSLMLVLTPLNSFCAVTSRDCPKTTHQWMSARDFQEVSKISADDRRSSGSNGNGGVTATFQCRLCNESSIKKEKQQQPYKPPNSYVAAPGACQDTKTLSFIGCAMESTDCEDDVRVLPNTTNSTTTTTTTTNTIFVSSQQLYQQGLVCPIEKTYNWGECTSTGDKIECTNQAESCYYDFRFEKSQPPNNHCTMYHNTKTTMPTYFSYCSPRIDNDNRDWKEIRCVWDQSECDTSTERWEEAKIPNNAWFPGCLCEDVLTGVCKEEKKENKNEQSTNTDNSYYYYCAVSAKGCTHPSSYIPQRLLASNNINSTSCPLCLSSLSRRSPPLPPPLLSSSSPVIESLPPSSFSPSPPPISDSSITTTTISPLLPFPPSNNDNMKEQMISNEYYNSDTFDDEISSGYGYGYSSDNNNDIVLSPGAITGIAIAVVVVLIIILAIIAIAKSSSTMTTTNSAPSAVAERGHQQDEENNAATTTITNTAPPQQQPPQVPLPLPLSPSNHDEELLMHSLSATIT